MKKPILALGLLTGVLLLQGCAAVVVGGAAGTAKTRQTSPHPGRPSGTIRPSAESRQPVGRQQALSAASKISVYSNNGRVLLVGQTPSDAYKQEAGRIVSRVVEGLRHVYNELRLGKPSRFHRRAQ